MTSVWPNLNVAFFESNEISTVSASLPMIAFRIAAGFLCRMNDDFSEVLSKFSDILKDKNINLENLVGGEPPPPTDNSDFSLDIETILKIKNIMSKINQNQSCPRNKLLYSLEPYLENDKKEKLEQYIKIANLLSVLENFDFGITFQDKNKKGYDFILIITLFLLIL